MTNRPYANAPENSRNAVSAPFTYREWFTRRRTLWHLSALAISIALFGYLGPFGSYDRQPLGERLLYWAAAMAGNWVFSYLLIPVGVTLLAGRLPVLAAVFVGAAVAAIPGTAVIVLLELVYSGKLPQTMSLFGLYASVLGIHLAIGLIVWTTIDKPLRTGEIGVGGPIVTGAAGAKEGAAPLLDRLPAALHGTLLHLRMQDHYVEIHTDKGSELVLMRFGDALKELGDTPGMQVHRSHWIARDALARIARDGGRTVAHLTNGTAVPVSRSYVKALRDANWV